MAFDIEDWRSRLKLAKSSEDLRAMLYEIPDDYNGSGIDKAATHDVLNIQTKEPTNADDETLVTADEVKQAWYKLLDKAQSTKEIDELLMTLGMAEQFLIIKEAQRFYIKEQVTALIPLE